MYQVSDVPFFFSSTYHIYTYMSMKKDGHAGGWRAKHVRCDISEFDISIHGNFRYDTSTAARSYGFRKLAVSASDG